MKKEKPCKGTGQAKGYGCGKLSNNRFYGLCMSCRKDFLLSDDGKATREKYTLKAKKSVKKEEKEKKAEEKRSVINFDGKLQSKAQELVRLLDMGHKCLALDKMVTAYDGGHVYGKGAHRECRFNLHNIFAQSSDSNRSTQDDVLMINGVERVFGAKYRTFVESLKNKPLPNLTKQEVEKAYRRACKIVNQLKREGRYYTDLERIEMRNKFNKEIGIYTEEQSVFKE